MRFMLIFLYVLLLISNVTVAQQDVVFVFTADRPDSIYVTFDRDPVFNESRLGGGYKTVAVSTKPVMIRYPNVTKMARLSLGSYGWPGNFMATDWIVEPNDSIRVFIEFEGKPHPLIKFIGRGALKYQLAFEASEHTTRIRAAEFDIYDNIKNHEQVYQEVAFREKKCLNLLRVNKKGLSRSIIQMWLTDIQATADWKNTSNINYTIDFMRFYIRDNKKVNRTASQEVEVKPFFVNATPVEIKGKSINDWVFAVDKFTIPDAKHLVIEMFEHNGGRHLALSISNRTLVKARALP